VIYSLLERWRHLLQEIEEEIDYSKRQPSSVKLLAVSKTYPAEAIKPLLQAGQRYFGENRVQEACSKWPDFRHHYPDLELHLIGPLQTNKISQALSLFDVIQTLDRPKLVEEISKVYNSSCQTKEFYIQINIGQEPQKSGVLLESFETLYHLTQEKNLPVTGVMCIPPVRENPSPYFEHLAKIAHQYALKNVSMGMSHDFKTAIRLGSTCVRLGTALFGERS
jgi:pyridoxal phosphate enzyme (YggS family)